LWEQTVNKEQLGSIVRRILIKIDASKKLAFHADSKYAKFIKFNVAHQKLKN
jgi:hypothetical protein